ncbi:MAG: tetratricopeptide repeat protein [Deltaproteobacteria bacterium]|nr:tetratricopeptide repeat protein [Deltaproteobacteria bacterium]
MAKQNLHQTRMCFATKKTGPSIFIAIVFVLGAYIHAQGKNYSVIEKVSTYREGNTSVVLIELTGYSTYKVIPVEDNEMLIAFRDTELSSQVYTRETILGDNLIKGLEVAERPFHVASVLVKTYKPYEQIEYQIKEDEERFRIEMRHRLKTSVKASQQTFSRLLPYRSDPGPGEKGNSKAQKRADEFLASKNCSTEDGHLFLEAKESYRIGKWDKALVIFEKIIRVYPRSRHLEESYFLMAKSLHDKFKDEMSDHLLEITERYQTAMNKFPESDHVVDALLSMGKCYFQVGQKNPLMALRCFEKVGQEYSESKYVQEAKLEIAKTLYQIKSFKRSLGMLSEIVTMHPDSIYENPDILLYEGYNYYELGRLKEARDVFSKVVNYFPEMGSTDLILTRIADTFREDGLETRASKLYSLVARTYPDSEAGLISLLRLGEGAEQAENEKPPLLDEKGPGKGEEKPEEERSKAAAEIYEQIIKRYPGNPLSQVAMLKLASLHKKNKEYSQCIASLKKLLAKNPKTKLRDKVERVIQEAMLKLATVQRKEGNDEESVMTLKTILLD